MIWIGYKKYPFHEIKQADYLAPLHKSNQQVQNCPIPYFTGTTNA